jgi:molybdate transport system permease protein
MPNLRRIIEHISSNGYRDWIFILPALFLLGLLGLPLLALLVRAFNADFFVFALSPSALKALRLSLYTSLLTMALTILFGTPLAYMLARWKFPFKSWIELLIDLPIVLPPSVAGLALLIAFGRRGIFGAALGALGISLPFTTAAVVIAQIFVAAPLYIRAARVGFSEVDRQLEEAAHVEGADTWQLFREVMLPMSRRSLISGAILTWTRALGEFGATILFAGNLEGLTQTMPLAIYLGFERDLGVAVALSVMLLTVSVVLLLVTRQLEKNRDKIER